MSAINATPLLLGGEGYQISRSVRLRSSASAYFSRTPSVAGNRRTFTVSMWVKRGLLDSTERSLISAGNRDPSLQNMLWLNWSATGQLRFYGDAMTVLTTPVYRDPSSWYHVVVAVDTPQATAANRVRLYVNNAEVTAFATANYPAQNYDFHWNNNTFQEINRWAYNQSSYGEQYFAEMHGIDGQALTPSAFGETDVLTGVWKPKKYTGTYGTNGFYLNFSDPSAATAAAIGKDYSGNGNNWTPNNISVTAGVTYDSMLDVPTPWADGGNGRGNYCVLNPLKRSQSSAAVTDGNLMFVGVSGAYVDSVYGTIGVTGSGRYYFEVNGGYVVGVNASDVNPSTNQTTGRVVYHGDLGSIFDGASAIQTGLVTVTSTDVVGVALNLDAGTLAFYKNNTQIGTNVSINTANTWWPFLQNSTTYANNANFGQRPFSYTPPSGFKALNTQNLPEPTIKKGNQYFNTVLYTGNATARSITGVGFQPDFVWTKSRSGAESHRLYDAVRGTTQSLYSNLTNAETTEAQSLTAFGSDGFSLGTGAPNSNAVTYVAWQWKESPSAGFDIVTYTGTGSGTTVSHSLGVAPKMMIVKQRSASGNYFVVWMSGVTSTTQSLWLGATNAILSTPNYWNSTAPTSSVFSVGNDSATNGSGSTYVAYLFAEVPGFSKFGSYTGNGSADGPFVFCGFRPRFVMIKRTDSTSDWYSRDSTRDTYNPINNTLFPNTSAAEEGWAGAYPLDLTSNGFKLRTSVAGFNASGGTFIFAAFAEHPFKNSLAR